jgi:predicted phage terminase large subunit-like protein
MGILEDEDLHRIERVVRSHWDIRYFAETYLPHHLTDEKTGEHVPFGPHHLELFELVEKDEEDKHVLRAEPREHGKSTVMDLIVALWWLATKRKNFIVLVADTASQAEGHLHSIIEEIEGNDLLRADYPHLLPGLDAKGQYKKWTDREIINTAGQIMVAAGAGKSLRGLKRRQHRPDAVIVDDLENDEHVATKGQRDKLENWFLKALLSLGGKGCDFFYIGTILHHDSVMMRVEKAERARREFGEPPIWDTKIVAAEDAEGSPLWPERWDRERLAQKKREIGSIAYAQEFLNDPSKREGKLFKEDWFRFYPLGARPENLDEYMGLDPSSGEKEQSDYIGIANVGLDKDGRIFAGRILETKITFHQLLKTIFALGDHIKPVKIGVETNFFQKVLKQELDRINREEHIYLPFAEQRTVRDKVTRFLSLSALCEAGLFWLEEGNPEHTKLLNQMLEFPDGAHDDLIDAFDFAVQAARSPVAGHFTEQPKGEAKPVTAGMGKERY